MILLPVLASYVASNTPFVLYANCNVVYDGRASSLLSDGNFLTIYKSDGSLQIHGADKIMPRNYQGAKSRLSFDGRQLVSHNKREKILVNINQILQLLPLQEWSDHSIVINKTEKELVEKLLHDWQYFIDVECHTIVREYSTDYGPVDLVGVDIFDCKHVVEVKRRKASIKDVTQLRKYLECIPGAKGYIAAPNISPKASKYLSQHQCRFITIDFDA